MMRVAINGFGRIGRMVFRSFLERSSPFVISAINDIAPLEVHAHLLQYDSVHGRLPYPVTIQDNCLCVKGHKIPVSSTYRPEEITPSDVVLECSGHFTKRAEALRHRSPRILISAPAEGADLTVVYGVNHHLLKNQHALVSNASCTTNALAPLVHILHQHIGIAHGHMTTIHAYTGDQRLVDTAHNDLRRARAANLSMVPTSTGAAKAVGDVIPELKGKLDGTAIRVPCANVSLVDFTFRSETPLTTEIIHQAFLSAEKGAFSGILATHAAPLVSCDFNHDPHSCTIDLSQTRVVDRHLGRVMAWYDNEWGFSNRMLDVVTHWTNHFGAKGLFDH